MQRKQDQAIVVAVSSFRRLTRSSSPFCVGFFALSLTQLAAAGPVPVLPQDTPAHPPLQSTISSAISTPAAAPAPAEAPKPAAPEAPKPADADASKPIPEIPKPDAPKPQAAAPQPAPPAPQIVHAAAPAPAAPVPAPAPPAAHAPTTQEKIAGLERAADLLIEVNTALGAPHSPYGQIIYDIALRHSVNPQLVAALIHVESAFNPRAVSRKGAYGLMQILPETARRFGVNRKRDLLDPAKNLEAGVKYLRWLTDRFGGNVHKILAAYNAGEGAVDRFDGIPPYRETQSYVQKIFGLLGFNPDPASAAPAAPVKDSVQPDVVPAGR